MKFGEPLIVVSLRGLLLDTFHTYISCVEDALPWERLPIIGPQCFDHTIAYLGAGGFRLLQ